MFNFKINNWRSLASASETYIEMLKTTPKEKDLNYSKLIVDWACTSIEAYLKTLKYHLFNSRMYIAKIFDIIAQNVQFDADDDILKVFDNKFQN
jgi:hypothetical protein